MPRLSRSALFRLESYDVAALQVGSLGAVFSLAVAGLLGSWGTVLVLAVLLVPAVLAAAAGVQVTVMTEQRRRDAKVRRSLGDPYEPWDSSSS